jgi:ATP/maltotriose-dependent transcriptional regulator MalT
MPNLPDLDEFVGYHLEQAFRLRSELGESDGRARRLAYDAGQRLGVAGMRAFRRGDSPAAANLLGRAILLLPHDLQLNRELRCNLAIATAGLHDWDRAVVLLEDLIADSRTAGDDRIEAWARIELEYLQIRRGQLRTADDLLTATAAGIPIFERVGDHRALGRAWLFTGWAQGGHRGNHAAWADAAERALVQYRTAAWPASTCLGEIASALYWGPTPAADAIARCEQLSGEATDPVGAAYLDTFIGGLVAQLGEFDRARTLVTAARSALEDRGHRAAARSYCMTVQGEIELLAGESDAAEVILRELCDELVRNRDLSHLASRSSDLAKALIMQGAFEEAEEWTHVAERNAAADDVNAQMMWRPVRARIHAERGALEIAEKLAREGVRLSDQTDDLNRRADAYRYLGEVLRRSARLDESSVAFERALELHQRKGNLMGVALVSALIAEHAPA